VLPSTGTRRGDGWFGGLWSRARLALRGFRVVRTCRLADIRRRLQRFWSALGALPEIHETRRDLKRLQLLVSQAPLDGLVRVEIGVPFGKQGKEVLLCLALTATCAGGSVALDRKSTRLNSSHVKISYAVFCLKQK